VPALQGVQTAALPDEMVPAAQETQLSKPVAVAKVPAAQLAHAVEPVAFWKEPAKQGRHAAAAAAAE